MPLEEVGCPGCESRGDEPVVVSRDRFATPGGEFSVVRCRRCGLAYTNPRPAAADIGVYYPREYSCHQVQSTFQTGASGRWRSWLEKQVLRARYGYPPQPVGWASKFAAGLGNVWIRNAQRRSEWIEYQRPGRLLDFGCGGGAFLARMRKLGWHVSGVDVSAAVARTVEEELGIRVLVGSLPHPDLRPASYDCITMWQSLEHVHEPRRVLRAARELLRPDGLLVVAVPNFDSWSFQTFREHWFGLDVPRHLLHFTPSALGSLLAAEQFRVERIEQLAMDGWLRHSARRARAAGWGRWWLGACRWKPLAAALARRSRNQQQADVIVATARPELDL